MHQPRRQLQHYLAIAYLENKTSQLKDLTRSSCLSWAFSIVVYEQTRSCIHNNAKFPRDSPEGVEILHNASRTKCQ
jgi:hypothetical protein